MLLLAFAVLAFVGYDRWQAPEIPNVTPKQEGYR
jgi:hypothetical protein